MSLSETFGKRLRALREQRGLRQEDIGKVINVGKSAVSQWESGARIPDLETVNRLSSYFGVSVDYLLGRTDSREAPQYDKIKTSADEVTELLETLHKRPEMKMLFSITKNATKEDIEKAVKIIEALKDN